MQESRTRWCRRQQRSLFSVLVLATALIRSSAGQVVFTNFGPGQSYDPNFVYVINGNVNCALNIFDVQAVQFRPSFNSVFTDAKLALGLFSGANELSVYLETDVAGQPGAIIERIDVTGLQPVFPGSVITATSVLRPVLLAGTSYWLVAAASNATTCAGWARNSTGDVSNGTNFAHNFIPSPTGPFVFQVAGLVRPAFQIDGTPTGAALDEPFQVKVFPNLLIGDSIINLTNTGANGTTSGVFGFTSGNICVNVYTFDAPSEEMAQCCSCSLTPNQGVNISVRNLAANSLTGVSPSNVVVKLIATRGDCTSNTPATIGAGDLVNGLVAFGTNIHASPVVAGGFAMTETRFIPSTLGAGELAHVVTNCSAIQAFGSGHGICPTTGGGTCVAGVLGGARH